MQQLLPSPVLPPTDENLFIPDAIDFNLKHNPDQPCYTYADPKGTNGVSVVTHLEFGRAAHRAAHALRPNRSSRDREVVAVIALCDTLLYQAIVAGLIVAGCVPFPISPRNTPAAIANLLGKTSCYRLLTTQVTLGPLIQGIKSHIAGTSLAEGLQVDEIPAFQTVYPNLAHESSEHPFERYPTVKRPSKDDVCLYIHSSGSTGFPKAIAQTYRACVHWALCPCTIEYRDYKIRLTLAVMPLPPFHLFGIYTQLINTLYGVTIVALYPPTATSRELLPVTPSPQNILEHSKKNSANVMVLPPIILQIWSQSSETIHYLKQFELVVFAGGSLAPKLGNRLVDAGVNLHGVYGATEIGGPTRLFPLEGDEREWEYISFHERTKIRWVPQGDGIFECQFLEWENHVPMVNNLDDVKGYATSDLFKNHPTKKHLWKMVGRKDDVIVHSNSEKTVPAPIEDVIMSSPLVQAAIMFGEGRSQAGVLIEPGPGRVIDVNDSAQVASFRNELWPIIDDANEVAPAFSRIFKDMILISSNDKPLPRAGKGTVMRKAAIDLYAKEINALYDLAESSTGDTESFSAPTSWSLEDVEGWITEQADDLVSSVVKISSTRDLFEQGFDSLSAASLGRRIYSALHASAPPDILKTVAEDIPQNLVYTYPVIRNLASHITSVAISSSTLPSGGQGLIEALVKKYTAGFVPDSGVEATISHNQSRRPVILLTGSTGNLGSEILATLLKDDRVDKIYAFNRRNSQDTLLERHSRRFKDKGIDVNLLTNDKLVFISGDTGQSDLGLDRGQYRELQNSVNIVIHNAWKLDFNLRLSSFEPLIQGTRHILDFIQSGPQVSNAHFLFLSSIASAQSWHKSRGPLPEEIVTDISSAVGTGYGESKYVAERVVAQSGLQSMSIRIGQISGGFPNGAWATSDWVPILVKSSIALGVLPGKDESGHVSWLPMDIVATSVVDLALAGGEVPSAVLNLVHPRPVKWKEVIGSLQSVIKEVLGHDLELVTFSEWISAVEAHANKAKVETAEVVPAVKLLNFFRSLARQNDSEIPHNVQVGVAGFAEFGGLALPSTNKMTMATGNLMGASKLQQLNRQDAERWIKYWRMVGFLN